MEPLLAAMPAVKSPEGHVHFKNKLMWTLGILILYFALTNIPLFGLASSSQDVFMAWRALLAGASGSIVHLGIGPIVTASIVLQLLKGADILHIDTSEARGQVMYMGLQKILILVMIVIEAAPNLIGGFMQPDPTIAAQFFGGNLFAVSLLIFIQICIGGVLVFLMDEVVTKWGIGSGVGLFIIAGISQALVNGFINWTAVSDPYPVGFFPRLFAVVLDGANFVQYFGTNLLAFATTIIIFLIIVYVESTRIEIPLAHAQVRGARARFPVKLIYASVLPMILVRVLQANIQMVGMFLSNVGITILGKFSGQTPQSGLMYLSCAYQRSHRLDVVGVPVSGTRPGKSSSGWASIPPSWWSAAQSSRSSGSRPQVSIPRMSHGRSRCPACLSPGTEKSAGTGEVSRPVHPPCHDHRRGVHRYPQCCREPLWCHRCGKRYGVVTDREYHVPAVRGDRQPADHGDVPVHADVLWQRMIDEGNRNGRKKGHYHGCAGGR